MNHLEEAKRQANLFTETSLDNSSMEHDNAIAHVLIAIAEQLEMLALTPSERYEKAMKDLEDK